MTTEWGYETNRIRSLFLRENDIVILMAQRDDIYEEGRFPLIRLTECYDFGEEDPRDYLWDIPYHINEKMNRRIAAVLEHEIRKIPYPEKLSEAPPVRLWKTDYHLEEIYLRANAPFREWFEKQKHLVKSGKNGAIVMNCNPFTNGHRYLVEQASREVDTLYIFVVQEDKSFFSFDERFRMVKEGCKEFENVVVIAGGDFLISVSTMPGYFEKEDLQDDYIYDATYDLEVFCEAIAPLFHIQTRFAGEEPEDAYTRRYNEQMAQLLPTYHLNFREIPRLATEAGPVSGSLCRNYFKEQDWESLSRYVPESTMEILTEKVFRKDIAMPTGTEGE